MFATALVLALCIGVAMAGQSPTNAALGRFVGPVQASLVSFTGGLLVVSVLCALFGTGNIAGALQAPWWQLLGGVYGAFVVFSMAMTTPTLGVALALTLFMVGQLFGGMVVDGFGLMGVDAIPISPLRAGGCVLALAGIVLVYIGRMRYSAGQGAAEGKGRNAVAVAVVLASGVGSAVQAPTNAALGAAIGTLEASVVSFAGGFICLLVATLVMNKGRLQSFKGAKLWHFTGGLYGAFGVPALVVATPVLGVSLAMAANMLGQLVGGMVVDATGAYGVMRMRADALRIAGAVLLLCGIALVTVAKLA